MRIDNVPSLKEGTEYQLTLLPTEKYVKTLTLPRHPLATDAKWIKCSRETTLKLSHVPRWQPLSMSFAALKSFKVSNELIWQIQVSFCSWKSLAKVTWIAIGFKLHLTHSILQLRWDTSGRRQYWKSQDFSTTQLVIEIPSQCLKYWLPVHCVYHQKNTLHQKLNRKAESWAPAK